MTLSINDSSRMQVEETFTLQIEVNRQTQLEENQNARETVRGVNSLNLDHLANKEEEKFIEKARVNRRIVIRSAKPSEINRILKYLYTGIFNQDGNLSEEEFEELVNREGRLTKRKENHRLMVMHCVETEELIGSIHYHIFETAKR